MRITVDISMYPLNEAFVGDVKDFILRLRREPNVEVLTNQLSTQLRGEFDAVTEALNRCMRVSMEKSGSVVFITKFLNADLDISTPPKIESVD
jgi:uncharacterized protein YqgV (UPF0045/DUF77 family)